MVEFHVLRCAECQTFQVLQVTKTAKWKCKMCGQKQSITKVYGQGSGADCRRHVQKLNSFQCQATWMREEQNLCSASQMSTSPVIGCQEKDFITQQTTTKGSRWSCYLDEPNDDPNDIDDSLLGFSEIKSNIEMAADWTDHTDSKMACKRKSGTKYEFLGCSRKKSKIFNEPARIVSSVCKDPVVERSDYESHNDQCSTYNLEPTLESTSDKHFFKKSRFIVQAQHSSSSGQAAEHKRENSSFIFSERLSHDDVINNESISSSSESSARLCQLGRPLVRDVLSQCTRSDNKSLKADRKRLTSVDAKHNHYLPTTGSSKWVAFLNNDSNVDETDDDTCLENGPICL